MIQDFTAIDLETTGLDPKRDKITEIGAVRVREGKITEHFSTLVNPGRKLTEQIISLTGLQDEELSNAPEPTEAIPQLLDFLGEDVLLGHSVLFDYSFIKRAAVNQGFMFEKEAIDKLADIAVEINQNVENIGARRLHTVLELLLEDISYSASDTVNKSCALTVPEI